MVKTKESPNILDMQSISHKSLTWTDIDSPSRGEMEKLKETYPFHTLDLEDCLSKVQLPKIDEYDDYLFLVLHFPRFDHKTRITQSSQVSIFLGSDYLITVHNGELRPLVKLFKDAGNSSTVKNNLMSQSSGYLLYQILDVLVDNCFPIMRKIYLQVDSMEAGLFGRNTRATIRELAILRRDVIAYRRIIRPQIQVMESLEQKKYPLLALEPEIYFGDLADHTRRIWVELEEVKEVVEALNDTVSTLNTHFTNDVIRILTVVFTSMLPFVVISGIYGMNLPLPVWHGPGGNSMDYIYILLTSAIISTFLILYFRLRSWI
jgi:magnesium transporter